MREFLSSSAEETFQFASYLQKEFRPGSILCLSGDLGSGKTTFVKGVVRSMGNLSDREVSSPTFSYLHIYPGKIPVYHFDLYRLKNYAEFCALGFDEYLNGDGVCCIEWAERIQSHLPKDALFFSFAHAGDQKRKIEIGSMQWA